MLLPEGIAWQTISSQHAAGMSNHVCPTLIKRGFCDPSGLCNYMNLKTNWSLVAFFLTRICSWTKISCWIPVKIYAALSICIWETAARYRNDSPTARLSPCSLWFNAAIMFFSQPFVLNLKSQVIHISTKGEWLSEKKLKKAKLDWIPVYYSTVSFSFQDKLDKVHCRNFRVTVSPSCLQCRLSCTLDYCLGLNSMDSLRKGRAGHPLCFFFVSWHASLPYLTHFNSSTRWIPPLSMLAPVWFHKQQHAAAFGGTFSAGNLLSSCWEAFRDLHIIPLSAVMSINILWEGTAACFPFQTSRRALHVSHSTLCPLSRSAAQRRG